MLKALVIEVPFASLHVVDPGVCPGQNKAWTRRWHQTQKESAKECNVPAQEKLWEKSDEPSVARKEEIKSRR